MFLSIILPAYNEAETIPTLLSAIGKILKKRDFEIVVVDDHSPDGTSEVLQLHSPNIPRVRLVTNIQRIGLAKSILKGIKSSRGDYILVMDSDFNHHPRYIPKFISLAKSYDLIVGSRYIKGGGMYDRPRFFLSMLYNLFVRLFLNLQTHDNLSGFFLMEKKSIMDLTPQEVFQGYGDYFIRLLTYAHQKPLRIFEIPVYYEKRFAGESKSRFLRMFLDYSKTVLQLKKSHS
ncbi:glycosyltransferase [Candidatus Gottesmanbacteria bacterium]|nr:glycosyltransferase [Candidatus Gottesmanbacteria bacterium]